MSGPVPRELETRRAVGSYLSPSRDPLRSQRPMRLALAIPVVALSCLALPLRAQTVSARIDAVRDGAVRFSYASRADVCGDGETMIGWHNTQMQFFGSWSNFSDGNDWRDRCVRGPLRVTITRRDGQSVTLKVMAGPARDDAQGATDLGTVPVADAVRALMRIARSEDSKSADRAILASALADSVVVWPELLALARDAGRPKRVRIEARQWLAWLAGDHVLGPPTDGRGKKGLHDEKTQAVFVLSELPHGEGIPDLLRIGRSHKDSDVRRSALFWLGQSNDLRALDLFEDLLRRP